MVSTDYKAHSSSVIDIREERIKRNLARLDELISGDDVLLARTQEYLRDGINSGREESWIKR